MRVLVLPLLLPLCTLALPARAQNAIHHCVDAHGNPLFTDQPCTSQQATPVQAPAPVQRCASTAAELRQRVIDAFAARDPNQLAGLMLWHGYGRVSAVGDLRALSQLVRQPWLEIHLGGAPDDDPASAGSSLPPEASSAATPADELQLRTSGDDGERSARFVIARQAGCLWLRYGS